MLGVIDNTGGGGVVGINVGKGRRQGTRSSNASTVADDRLKLYDVGILFITETRRGT